MNLLYICAGKEISKQTSGWNAAHTNVVAVDGSRGSPEAKTNVLEPSSAALANSLALAGLLVVEEDVGLFLVSALALDSQLSRHVC